MKNQVTTMLRYGLLSAVFLCCSVNEAIAQRGVSRTSSKTSTVSKSSPSRSASSSSRTSSSKSSYKPSRSSSSSSYKPSRSSSSYSPSRSSSSSSSSSSYSPSRSSSSSSSSYSSESSSNSYSSSKSSSKSYSSSSSGRTPSSSNYSSIHKPVRKPIKVLTYDDQPKPKPIKEKTLSKQLPIYPKTSAYQVIEELGKTADMRGPLDDQKTLSTNVVTLAAGLELNELMVDQSGKPLTVAQAVAQLPQRTRDSISNVCTQQIESARAVGDPKEVVFWQNMRRTFNRPKRKICLGKSYGDPHMRTYDGYYYDLQAIGEFVLTKSRNSSFLIQTRQSQTKTISLNTAAAMYVNGDIVTVYTQNFPDSYDDIPLRVNGNPLNLMPGQTYGLHNGGVVAKVSNYYRISWPGGEQVVIKFFTSQSKKYMNVMPKVYAANNAGAYEGLLGNADGFEGNDLMSRSGVLTYAEDAFYDMETLTSGNVVWRERRSEVKYNKELLEQFGESWRVEPENSLFEYPPGKTYYSFYGSRSMSSVSTLAKLKRVDVLKAKDACEAAGITDEKVLKTCMLDVATSGDESIAKSIAEIENDSVLVEDFDTTNQLRVLE